MIILHDPSLALGTAALIVCGVISAYYLMRGFREGRIARRLTFPYPAAPLPDGREGGYAYRDVHTSLFWTEAGMLILAVACCTVVLFVLVMAPDAPIR
jgi:hypothetical protein